MMFLDFHPFWQYLCVACIITLTAVMAIDWKVDMFWFVVLYVGVFSAICSATWGEWK